jgi:hypothetical protein
MSGTPAPERKVVERKVLFESDGIRSVSIGLVNDLRSGISIAPDHYRIVAERLEEEPSEFELAARDLEYVAAHWTETSKDRLNAARLHREADRRLREASP